LGAGAAAGALARALRQALARALRRQPEPTRRRFLNRRYSRRPDLALDDAGVLSRLRPAPGWRYLLLAIPPIMVAAALGAAWFLLPPAPAADAAVVTPAAGADAEAAVPA